MSVDNILVKMPEPLDCFLAAASVVQDYCVQLYKQVAMRQRPHNFHITVELANDGQLFFWPMFPQMECVMRGEVINLSRSHWSCVMDFTDIARVLKVAEIPKKHITESWGIMFGASPQPLPGLGPLMNYCAEPTVDVLIDERVPVKDNLVEYLGLNFPQAKVSIKGVEGIRPSSLFSMLADAKMFVGMRSGATYLACTMQKPTVELYGNDMEASLMSKPHHENYRMFYGARFDAGAVWAIFEEMFMGVTGQPPDFIADMQIAGGM